MNGRFDSLPGVGDNRGGQVLSMSAITADKGGSFGNSGGGADTHIAGLQQLKGHLDNIIDGWEQPPGEGGPDISVISFVGRWLPLGEAAKRTGELVITIRETIGWKYDNKPPPPGKEAKPSADRKIGLLIREFYIDTALREAPPIAPGLGAQWALYEKRLGR